MNHKLNKEETKMKRNNYEIALELKTLIKESNKELKKLKKDKAKPSRKRRLNDVTPEEWDKAPLKSEKVQKKLH